MFKGREISLAIIFFVSTIIQTIFLYKGMGLNREMIDLGLQPNNYGIVNQFTCLLLVHTYMILTVIFFSLSLKKN